MKKFSISDIACSTGIKAHTIRIWEQRYNLVTPKRTETNIRYYDECDLKKFMNIALLLESGKKISEIAKMSPPEIMGQINTLAECEVDGCHCTVSTLCQAMVSMDEAVFVCEFRAKIRDWGIEAAMLKAVFPMLHKIGLMRQAETINSAQEAFVINLIKHRLIAETAKQVNSSFYQPKKFMLFLQERDANEIGLLFANYLIKKHGHRTLYLGANVALEDLNTAAEYYQPDYIMSFLLAAPVSGTSRAAIEKLKTSLPNRHLVVSGACGEVGMPCNGGGLTILESEQAMIEFINSAVEEEELAVL